MSEYNSVLNDARQTKEAMVLEKDQKGAIDPLLEAKLKRLERRLATLETKRTSIFAEMHSGEGDEYQDAFLKYLRKGDEGVISKLAKNGVQLNDAGFAVANSMESLIQREVARISVLRSLASVTQISSDSLDLAIEEAGAGASWGEATQHSTVLKKYIKAYDVIAQPKATPKLLEDGEIDVESYVGKKIAESFARVEDESFILGDGISKPIGMLTLQNGTSANEIEHVESALTFEGIMDLQASLDSVYANDVSYLMNKNTESEIRFLKDTNGNYIWRPAEKQGEHSTILGVPVCVTNYMPHGSNAKSIIFGNFKQGYHVIERVGVNILRDPFTEKPFVKFYTLRRVGGDVVDGRALKVLKRI